MYFDSSIGSHVRHSLDHYNTVLENVKNNNLFTYDQRRRQTIVETDVIAGLHQCENIIKQISSQNVFDSHNLGSIIYINYN